MHVVDGDVAFVLGYFEVVVDFWKGAFEMAVDGDWRSRGCHGCSWMVVILVVIAAGGMVC